MKFKTVIGALAVLAASSTLAPAQDAVSLRLNWYLGGLHVPFYYGKERGFYKEEGIDLTINEGRLQLRPRTTGRSSITALRSLYYIMHVLLGVFVNVLKFDRRRLRSIRTPSPTPGSGAGGDGE